MLFNTAVFEPLSDFRVAILILFRSSLVDVVALSSANQPHDVEEEDEDGEPSTNGKRSTELTQEQWRDIFGIIGDFGTLETFDNCFADTLVEHIDAKVRETVAGKFEVPKLKSLETWLGTVAIPWLSMVLGRPIAEVKKEWLSKIEFYLFECFLQVLFLLLASY